jgi:hypothetical protein
VSKKKHDPALSGWLKVVVGLAVAAVATTAQVGHAGTVSTWRPTTGCVQVRVL